MSYLCIPLRGKYGGTALVSESARALVDGYHWYGTKSGYAVSPKVGLMHRRLMAAEPTEVVDHKNFRRLDNRYENLICCPPVQNHWRRQKRNTQWPYKGVRKVGQSWQARIMAHRKATYLGSFQTAEEAALAYDAASMQAFGDQAITNFGEQAMDAIVPIRDETVQAEIIPPKQHSGLMPKNMTEAMKFAEMMANAKLVPAALQKSSADCFMVIQQAIRWDMDPFAVAQECSVIQGKLMHSGKLVAAVVNARGNLTSRLSFEYRGDGDNRTIVVSGQLQGEPQPRVVEVTLKNARTANTMWQKQPDQQLMYHGVRVWARRHTPELMLGVWSEEEFDDIPVQHRRPPPPAPNAMLQHDPETGEVSSQAPNNAVAEQAAPSVEETLADGAALSFEDMAREAAMRGEAVFKTFYKSRNAKERERLNAMGDELRGLMT